MRPRVCTVDRLLFVRWDTHSTSDDMRFVANATVEARRLVGRPLILIAIMPPDTQLPDDEARREAIRLLPLLDRLCESQYAVLLGNSFRSALLRGGLSVVTSIARYPSTIVDTIEAAVNPACSRLGIDPCTVLAELRARGFSP